MRRIQTVCLLVLTFWVPSLHAGDVTDPSPVPTPELGFEKPAVAEREFYGYDPAGLEYRQNRVEDFQVIFVETAPFAALLSFGTTALVSALARGKVSLTGGYLAGAAVATVALSGTVAYVSVKGKPYPPPESLVESLAPPPRLAFRVPLVQMRF